MGIEPLKVARRLWQQTRLTGSKTANQRATAGSQERPGLAAENQMAGPA
jgi:hypothetical protein